MINAAQTTFQSVSILEGLIYTFWYTKMTHLLLQQIKKKIQKQKKSSVILFELWRSWLIDWSIEVSQPEAEAAVMAYASHLIKHSKKVFILIRSLYYYLLNVSCFVFLNNNSKLNFWIFFFCKIYCMHPPSLPPSLSFLNSGFSFYFLYLFCGNLEFSFWFFCF